MIRAFKIPLNQSRHGIGMAEPTAGFDARCGVSAVRMQVPWSRTLVGCFSPSGRALARLSVGLDDLPVGVFAADLIVLELEQVAAAHSDWLPVARRPVSSHSEQQPRSPAIQWRSRP